LRRLFVKPNRLSFHDEFLRRYLRIAPAALAAERTMECDILSTKAFIRPVLDIGCGDGVFAHILFADAIDTGIDLDPTEIAGAQKWSAYNELIVCSGSAVPKPDASYQTAFSNSVLEHIPDVDPVLKEVHRLLAPGGFFYVTIPTTQWEKTVLPSRLLSWFGLEKLADRYGRFYNSFWKHYRALSIRDWASTFENAGFKVDGSQTYSPPNMTTMLDILTPLAAPAMISKKLFNRWIPIQMVRAVTARIIYPFVRIGLKRFNRGGPGGLVFFALKKIS
jgi:SAM-dependent methyltransferase